MLPDPLFLRNILPAAAVLFFAGLVWVAWFAPRQRDAIETLADAGGISLALIAIGGELGFFFDLPVLREEMRYLFGAFPLLAAAGLLLRHRLTWKDLGIFGLALMLFSALCAWRLYQARDLLLPAWVDSIHHTLIVEKILETGGLPDNLSPYLPIPFYYHYGFHLTAASYAFARGSAGADIPTDALLWFGQVISALATLGVYRLAKQAFGDWKRALLAALLVGFVFHMPAYYLSWGRYPLLTGLAVFSPAAAAALEVSQNPQRREAVLRLAVLTGGLALAHYLALSLLALFYAALIAVRLAPIFWAPLRRLKDRLRYAWELPLAGGLGILLALPWLLRVYHFIPFIASVAVTAPPESTAGLFSDDQMQYILTLLGPQPSHFLLALAGGGLLITAFQRGRRWLVVWGLILAALALPWGIRLSGFRPDHYAILMFLPAALLSAHLLVSAAEAGCKRLAKPLGFTLLALAVSGLLMWGVRTTANIINPVTVLADRADLQALEWIKENTPVNARFYHYPVYWQYDVYRGADGAAWLLPYTRRESMVPPALYNWGAPEYYLPIGDWARRAQNLAGCSPDFWALVRDANLTHLYLRVGVGSLQASQLAECPLLQAVYDQGGVSIYQILRP